MLLTSIWPVSILVWGLIVWLATAGIALTLGIVACIVGWIQIIIDPIIGVPKPKK